MSTLNFLGTREVDGGKLKSSTLWKAVSGINRNGSDSNGFSALPAGLRLGTDGKFDALGTGCHFWTSTPNDSERAQAIHLGISNTAQTGIANKKFGYSVRCVRDK